MEISPYSSNSQSQHQPNLYTNLCIILQAVQCYINESVCNHHNCGVLIVLFKHIKSCNQAEECNFPKCFQTIRLLKHYLNCNNKICVCSNFGIKSQDNRLFFMIKDILLRNQFFIWRRKINPFRPHLLSNISNYLASLTDESNYEMILKSLSNFDEENFEKAKGMSAYLTNFSINANHILTKLLINHMLKEGAEFDIEQCKKKVDDSGNLKKIYNYLKLYSTNVLQNKIKMVTNIVGEQENHHRMEQIINVTEDNTHYLSTTNEKEEKEEIEKFEEIEKSEEVERVKQVENESIKKENKEYLDITKINEQHYVPMEIIDTVNNYNNQNPIKEEEDLKIEISNNVDVNEQKFWTQLDLENLFEPLHKKLCSEKDSDVFQLPVDWKLLEIPDYPRIINRPMDLSTILKKLKGEFSETVNSSENDESFDKLSSPFNTDSNYTKVTIGYHDPWEVISDYWLMFNNAWTYNKKSSRVYKMCTNLATLFGSLADDLMRSAGFCCGREYVYEPQVLICCTPEMCMVNRDSVYYSIDNNENRNDNGISSRLVPELGSDKYVCCEKCFNVDPGSDVVNLMVSESTTTLVAVSKSIFVKLKNNIKEPEEFVHCRRCYRKWHQVCAGHLDEIWSSGFFCPSCDLKRAYRRPKNVLTSSSLPHCPLSWHMETIIDTWRQNQTETIPKITVRVLSVSRKSCDIKPEMKRIFVENGEMPESLPYKLKAIFVFQQQEKPKYRNQKQSKDDEIDDKCEVDGDDESEICLFGMHTQEYGADCPYPNSRRVYLAYLDSVNFFEPRNLRTEFYHRLLISYLEYCRNVGFMFAHIWACPPADGDDYIFHMHPPNQKVPKPKRLQEWYISMLEKASNEGIVVDYSDIFSYAYNSQFISVSELPYFEGDYWPTVIESLLKEEEESQIAPTKSSSLIMSTPTLSIQETETDKNDALLSNPCKDNQNNNMCDSNVGVQPIVGTKKRKLKKISSSLSLSLSSSISKSNKINNHNYNPSSSNKNNFSSLTKRRRQSEPSDGCQDIMKRLFDLMEKRKENFFVIRLHQSESSILASNSEDDVKDDKNDNGDIIVNIDGRIDDEDRNDGDDRMKKKIGVCDLMDGRDKFLSLAREKHLEFSTCRRARFATLVLCYELHLELRHGVIYSCNNCDSLLLDQVRFTCLQCDEYELCESCASKKVHPQHELHRIQTRNRHLENLVDDTMVIGNNSGTETDIEMGTETTRAQAMISENDNENMNIGDTFVDSGSTITSNTILKIEHQASQIEMAPMTLTKTLSHNYGSGTEMNSMLSVKQQSVPLQIDVPNYQNPKEYRQPLPSWSSSSSSLLSSLKIEGSAVTENLKRNLMIMEMFDHAFTCLDANCRHGNCHFWKKWVLHYRESAQSHDTKKCLPCFQIARLIVIHRKMCRNTACVLPYCPKAAKRATANQTRLWQMSLERRRMESAMSTNTNSIVVNNFNNTGGNHMVPLSVQQRHPSQCVLVQQSMSSQMNLMLTETSETSTAMVSNHVSNISSWCDTSTSNQNSCDNILVEPKNFSADLLEIRSFLDSLRQNSPGLGRADLSRSFGHFLNSNPRYKDAYRYHLYISRRARSSSSSSSNITSSLSRPNLSDDFHQSAPVVNQYFSYQAQFPYKVSQPPNQQQLSNVIRKPFHGNNPLPINDNINCGSSQSSSPPLLQPLSVSQNSHHYPQSLAVQHQDLHKQGNQSSIIVTRRNPTNHIPLQQHHQSQMQFHMQPISNQHEMQMFTNQKQQFYHSHQQQQQLQQPISVNHLGQPSSSGGQYFIIQTRANENRSTVLPSQQRPTNINQIMYHSNIQTPQHSNIINNGNGAQFHNFHPS